MDRLVKFYTNSFGLKIVKGVGTATYLTDGHLNLAIIPIGPEGGDQVLQLVRKDGRASDLFPVRFVPLRRGRSGGG